MLAVVHEDLDGARGDLVPAKGPALSRPVDHQHGDAPLKRSVGLHEPHLVLDGVEPPHGDQAGLPLDGERRADEVHVESAPRLVRDLEHLAGRVQVPEEMVARLLLPGEGGFGTVLFKALLNG